MMVNIHQVLKLANVASVNYDFFWPPVYHIFSFDSSLYFHLISK